MSERLACRALVDRYQLLVTEYRRQIAELNLYMYEKRPSPQREALKQLANEHGVKVETMRSKLYRARARAEQLEDQEEDGTITPVDFETFGLTVPNWWLRSVLSARRELQTRLDLLRRGVFDDARTYPKSYRASIERQTAELVRRIEAGLPRGLCPFCKGLAPLQGDCQKCDQTGCGTGAAYADAGEGLLRREPLMVEQRGVRKIVERGQ